MTHAKQQAQWALTKADEVDDDTEQEVEVIAAAHRQEALVWATLAVADAIRENTRAVEKANRT